MKSPCLDCGELADASRCEDCTSRADAVRAPALPRARASAAARGYDSRWRRLSEVARRLQPFCEDCGSREDLQADHSPEAWRRKSKGLAVRLQDIAVVCGPCNIARGAARGPGARRDP